MIKKDDEVEEDYVITKNIMDWTPTYLMGKLVTMIKRDDKDEEGII